jgi:hypothetical protein
VEGVARRDDGLSEGFALGFSRPEDNLLPFLAEPTARASWPTWWRSWWAAGPEAEADRAQKRSEELLTQLGHKRWS